MSEELKEILEFDFKSQGERIEINEYERDILKDYITNLQEENEYSNYCNEQLRKKIVNLKYKIEKAEEENKELSRTCELYSKSLYNADLTRAEKRIDKAIEYIENNSLYEEIYDYNADDEQELRYVSDETATNDLLNILKGEIK